MHVEAERPTYRDAIFIMPQQHCGPAIHDFENAARQAIID